MQQERVSHAPASGTHDPQSRSHVVRQRFAEMIDHLRREVDKVDDPQFRALLETAAEVIGGLEKAFAHYDKEQVCVEKLIAFPPLRNIGRLRHRCTAPLRNRLAISNA